MKLPGRAWLEFVVEPRHGGATIRQTAIFDPVGLAGLAYWYLVFPLHRMVFSGMLENIARKANANRPKKHETRSQDDGAAQQTASADGASRRR
jgi:hypothetical protein